MLFNLLCSIAIPFALGVATANFEDENNYVNYDINNKIDTSESESSSEISYPIYDDLNYTITFNAYQLNNYVFDNLTAFIKDEDFSNDFGATSITYNDTALTYDDFLPDEGVYYINEYNDYLIRFNTVNSKFTYLDDSSNVLTFEDSAIWNLVNLNYDDIKTAIQADIQANEQTGTMGDNIIDAITSGLGLIGDLAREFLTGFGTLFWDATANNNAGALTPFGQFALVMLGVAITMAVISLILALIKGNTGA